MKIGGMDAHAQTAVGRERMGRHLGIEGAREIEAEQRGNLLQLRDLETPLARGAGAGEDEIGDIDDGARPLALERRHDDTARRIAREFSLQLQRMGCEFAARLDRAAGRPALVERRVGGDRELLRCDLLIGHILQVGRQAEVGARPAQRHARLDRGGPAHVGLQCRQSRQAEGEVERPGGGAAGAAHGKGGGTALDASIAHRPGLVAAEGCGTAQRDGGGHQIARHAGCAEIAQGALPAHGHGLRLARGGHVDRGAAHQVAPGDGGERRQARHGDRCLGIAALRLQPVGARGLHARQRRSDLQGLHPERAVGRVDACGERCAPERGKARHQRRDREILGRAIDADDTARLRRELVHVGLGLDPQPAPDDAGQQGREDARLVDGQGRGCFQPVGGAVVAARHADLERARRETGAAQRNEGARDGPVGGEDDGTADDLSQRACRQAGAGGFEAEGEVGRLSLRLPARLAGEGRDVARRQRQVDGAGLLVALCNEARGETVEVGAFEQRREQATLALVEHRLAGDGPAHRVELKVRRETPRRPVETRAREFEPALARLGRQQRAGGELPVGIDLRQRRADMEIVDGEGLEIDADGQAGRRCRLGLCRRSRVGRARHFDTLGRRTLNAHATAQERGERPVEADVIHREPDAARIGKLDLVEMHLGREEAMQSGELHARAGSGRQRGRHRRQHLLAGRRLRGAKQHHGNGQDTAGDPREDAERAHQKECPRLT